MNISTKNPIKYATANMSIKTSVAQLNQDSQLLEEVLVELKDDSGMPVTIEVASIRSDIARDLFLALKAKNLQADSEEFGLETICGLTLGWSDNLSLDDGDKFPYSQENVKKLYLQESWIGEQVIAFVTNHANFIPKI